MDVESRLQELKHLHDSGLITTLLYEKQQEATLSALPSQNQITHLEQYKMLREEIVQHMRALDSLQNAGAISSAAIYGWLIVHRASVGSMLPWFIAPAVLIFCAIKSLDLGQQMRNVAVYLATLEAAAFGDTSIPGWEQYKVRMKITGYDKVRLAVNSIAWVLIILGSLYLSWHLAL